MKTIYRSMACGLAGIGILLPAAFVLAQDAMTITGNNVGVGTDQPTGSIHVLRQGSETPAIVLESTNSGVKWEIRANANTGRLTYKDLNGTTTPFKFQPQAVENLFRVGILNNSTVDINGDLVITGNCTEVNGACADYVFEPGYELPSLDFVAEFIAEHRHLPNVPSTSDIQKNGVNLANFSGRLLEKIEELTLYTLKQQDTNIAQQEKINELQATVRELHDTNQELRTLALRVQQLEKAAK